MYVPDHFAPPSDEAVTQLLQQRGAGDLITHTAQGLQATFLPLLYDDEARVLRGHVARNNPQWRAPALGEALVIVSGPDGYVSPQWYPSKAEHGRVVPTWNYVTAHVYGEFVVHDDVDWVERLVRDLTDWHERDIDPPWSPDDAPAQFFTGQLRAIVGVEVRISSIQAKFKLSQNRPPADADGVIAALTGSDNSLADAMRAVRAQRPTA